MRALQRLSIIVGAICLSSPALAGSMPPDIAEKLAAMGRKILPPETQALYAPLHQMEPYPGIKLTRDISYGPAERNLLDVFTAENATGPRPVLLYAHGGGFVRGNKKTPNSPFNDSSFGLAVSQQAGVVPKSVSGFTQGTQWRVKVRGYKYKVEFEWSDWLQFKTDQN